MGIVVALQVGLSDIDLAIDLLPDHLLGDDAITDVLLEVLEGDALRLGGGLEGLHRIEMVLLADLVKLLDHLGFAGDAKLLALGEQQLLVDQVAEQVFLLSSSCCGGQFCSRAAVSISCNCRS